MEKKKLSHIVQDKIKEVEHKIIPGVTWDKQKSWDKIKDILSTKNKQLIMWYFATAASISILVAATADTTIPYFIDFLEQENTKEIVDINVPQSELTPDVPVRNKVNTEIIENKSLPEDNQLLKVTCLKNKLRKLKTSKATEKVISEKLSTPATPKFYPGTQLGSNSITGIAPGMSIDFRHYLKAEDNRNRYIAIGANTALIFHIQSEGGKTEIYPATFINAKYGQSKIENNRKTEWEIGAGYLLNPNQVIYKDTTVRFQYTRTITGKLKVGPELILTNNLRKLYPGITLAFG